ncbi:MAG: hypothetical protein GQF41_4369 [Candidatus Rifleibacterium amylolyticum]|nr:MAG: hypothetical protein GQF41_4369 [Candidatus Rifleibacterium amylolyticum]
MRSDPVEQPGCFCLQILQQLRPCFLGLVVGWPGAYNH